MKFALSLAAALLTTTAAVNGAYADLRVHDTDRQVPLDGKSFDIRNVSGSIAVSQAEGTTVRIHADATSRTSDPVSAQLDVRTEGDNLFGSIRVSKN